MEKSRARHRFPAVSWEAQDALLHNAFPTHNQQPFGYVEDFSRGYATPKSQGGSLAGLVIGTIAGVVAALMLSNVITPMW